MLDGALGSFGVLVDELCQTIEGVEEHVRVYLALEQAVLGDLGFNFEGFPELFGLSPGRDQSPHEHQGRTHKRDVETHKLAQVESDVCMSENPGIETWQKC